MSPHPSARAEAIDPFYVMEIVKAADLLEAAGRSVIHLSIGEPDFTAAPSVVRAAQRALAEGKTQYTPALGLPQLRARIADWYRSGHGLLVDPARIVVTAGASGALLLASLALLDQGDEVLMPDPSYPCNRHFVRVAGGTARLIPCTAGNRFQPSASLIAAHWGPRTRGVLLASPANPTGTSISPLVLRELLDAVHARGGFVIVDEIYQGLSDAPGTRSALALDDAVIVLNSFSKYFGMTGWRLGWMVAPPSCIPALERLAQNLFICPSAIAQHAALACFETDSLALYEERRAEFRRRRQFLVPALRELGFGIPAEPDGAFYVYADISAFSDDSWTFAHDLLDTTGVCVVPGRDFGQHDPARYVRLSYATSMGQLEEAVARMGRALRPRPRP